MLTRFATISFRSLGDFKFRIVPVIAEKTQMPINSTSIRYSFYYVLFAGNSPQPTVVPVSTVKSIDETKLNL